MQQSHPPPTHHPSSIQPIAPEKNFARVPNSIALNAIPAGIFRGESLKTWQALYQRTRAAVVPRRSIRATQAELMDWAGVSHNTLKSHLKHLTKAGLIKVHYRRGESDGAEYEVFTLEDRIAPTHHPPTTHPPTTSQNLVGPTNQNLVLGGGGQPPDFPTTYENPNTSFKTNTNDDEAFHDLVTIFKEATLQLTGTTSTQSDRKRWAELAQLIVAELNEAASHTGRVSSVPAFLTAHLKRRLSNQSTQAPKEKRRSESVSNHSDPAIVQPQRRLLPEEITEQSHWIAELLEGGYTLEQAESQFAGSFHAEDWQAIKDLLSSQSKVQSREGNAPV